MSVIHLIKAIQHLGSKAANQESAREAADHKGTVLSCVRTELQL